MYISGQVGSKDGFTPCNVIKITYYLSAPYSSIIEGSFVTRFKLSLISVNNNTLLSPSYSSLFPRSSPSFSSTLLIILSILVLLGVAALLILKTCHRRSLSMSHYKHFVLPISRTPSTVLEERQVRTTYVKNPCSCVVTYIKRERSVVVIILPRPVTSRPHATRVRE